MKRNKYLANRIREVLLDGKWIANTNFKEQILNLDWKLAVQKKEGFNSIASLTFHVNYYLEGLMNVFDGGKLEISDKFSFDMPEIKSGMDWDDLLTRFLKNSKFFADKVEALDEMLLQRSFVEEKYGTYERNIEAVIEHCYYHLGQVVLLKKMMMQKDT